MVERSANGCEELPENVADRNPVNVSLQRHLLLPVAQITNWAHSAELEFAPADLAIENLQRLQKDWKIQWTSKLSWHLHMIDYTIFVYWPATPFIESELVSLTLALIATNSCSDYRTRYRFKNLSVLMAFFFPPHQLSCKVIGTR